MQETKPNKAIVAVIVIVLLAATTAGAVYVLNNDKETSDTSTQTPTTSTSSSKTPASSSSAGTYKDGTYSATGSYVSPGGNESIDVTLAIADGTISSASVTTHPATSTSTQYQSEFTNNFKSLVIGKSVDDVKLSRVAGSSLTSNGFNDALEQIKDKANA